MKSTVGGVGGYQGVRDHLRAVVHRLGAVITQPLDAQVATLAQVVDELRRSIEALPASESSVVSATEAALVLSRAAHVVESQLAALVPAALGEVVVTAGEEDVDKLEKALAGGRLPHATRSGLWSWCAPNCREAGSRHPGNPVPCPCRARDRRPGPASGHRTRSAGRGRQTRHQSGSAGADRPLPADPGRGTNSHPRR